MNEVNYPCDVQGHTASGFRTAGIDIPVLIINTCTHQILIMRLLLTNLPED